MQLAPHQKVLLGPPGCGKTTNLLGLLDEEMTAGVPPQRIAYFSFTRKAVSEAKTRAADRFDMGQDELKFFRTLHSMTFSLGGFTKAEVMGLAHYKEIGERIGIEFGAGRFDESTGMPVGNCEGDTHLFIDSLARARCVSLEEQWNDCGIEDVDYRAVERTVAAVKKYKELHGLADFTDMLEAYVRNGQPIDVDVAFVDEAQDLSVLQWRVLDRLLGTAQRVYVAGDDDQAIYRWSGADVQSFLSLSGSRRVLEQSWRCPQQVHAVADSLATRIGNRIEKHWRPREERGRVSRVHTLEAFGLEELEGSTLLLARNTYLLNNYYDELRRRGLPYLTSYGSHSVSRSHARAIYAWERLRKGEWIEAAEARAIYDQLRVGVGVKRGHKSLPLLKDSAKTHKDILRNSMGLITGDVPWYEALDGIAGKDRAYYRSILRSKRSLIAPPTIAVNTIHGVKGGEADNVVINPDMAYRTHKEYLKAPDDEHRVAYVGVSRAKKNLFVLAPQTKNFYPYLKNN